VEFPKLLKKSFGLFHTQRLVLADDLKNLIPLIELFF
jgi:hypothetical protein